MNINFKFLLLGTSLSLIPQYAAGQCAVTDCLQLGYTSLKSCGGGLKCPFGEYWACPKVEEKAVLGECTGYAKNCKIGDILNNDGTCTTDNTKTPIGVVVYIGNDNCGYAMTASPVATNIEWSPLLVATGVGATKDWEDAIKNFNACTNTQKIIKLGDDSKYPAAWVAVNYAPTTIPETKGKWCLPAPGMLNSLYKNLGAINDTISKLGGIQLIGDNERIWSSSEYSDYNAWHFNTFEGVRRGGIYWDFKYGGSNVPYVVRPVIAF